MAIDDVFIKAFRAHRREGDLFHHDSHKAHELFQTSTVGALIEGVYDGEVTYEELTKHGDFGLGTFNALDGEMLAFDGRFYQMKAEGKAYPVAPPAKTPCAVVMFFDPTVKVLWEEMTDWGHFLNLDRTAGGHVLDFRMRDATVEVDVTSDLHMEVPDCGDFLDADLGKDQSESIEKAEREK